MAKRNCGDCGAFMGPTMETCRACGWGSKTNGVVARDDQDHMRCAWVAGFDRCRYIGTVARSTVGGGPWYCHDHFACDDTERGEVIVKQSHAQVHDKANYMATSVRTAAKRHGDELAKQFPVPDMQPGAPILIKPPRDSRKWARTIVEMYTAGSYHSAYGLTAACEVLGIDKPQRITKQEIPAT